MVNERLGNRRRRRVRERADVRDDRDDWFTEVQRPHERRKLGPDATHTRKVERRGDAKRDHLARATLRQRLADARHTLAVAGDRDLRRAVVVRDHGVSEGQGVLDDAIDLVGGKPDDRGHRALGPARCGEAPALGDESQGFLEREHAGRNERGELTERVTRDESWPKGERKGRNATRIRAARRAVAELFVRSEERRVGTEGRSRWARGYGTR